MPEPVPKIYVIDDDNAVRVAMRRLIRSAGYSVEVFQTAANKLVTKTKTIK